MKKRIKIIKLLVFSIVLILFACDKDLYNEHLHKQRVKSEITLEQFKNETGLKNFTTSIKIKSNPQNSIQRNSDGSYELSDFDINTEIIKRIVINEKITYTFQLVPKEVVNDSFFNIVYYYKDGWQYDILEIKPKPENLIEIKEGTTKRIDGAMYKLYSSNPVEAFDDCVAFTILVENCQGCTGTCDECAICVYHTSIILCGTSPSHLYIDIGPSTVGGSSSTGDGTNTSLSNYNTTSNSNNENEIATSPILNPIFLDGPPKTPCSELKKYNSNNAIQQTLRILKTQSSGQSEHGNYISDATNSLGSSYLSFPVVPQNPNNPNEIDISAGYSTGKVRGVMHCHRDPATTGMFPMFSAEDFGALYGIAYYHVPANNTQKDYAEYTVMLSVGSGHYALKFKNFNGNYNEKFNTNFSKFKVDLEKENILLGYMANSTLLIQAFLKNMNKYFGDDVGLYKATETLDSNGLSVVTGWKEQTLNQNGDIVEINCL